MRRHHYGLLPLLVLVLAFAGGGCFRRDSQNVFPGSDEYTRRVTRFKITPAQAYELAHEQAVTDNRLQFLSRRPTVVVKRWYVFSMPQSSGASLQGYHVNGDNGTVRFVSEKKSIDHTRR